MNDTVMKKGGGVKRIGPRGPRGIGSECRGLVGEVEEWGCGGY